MAWLSHSLRLNLPTHGRKRDLFTLCDGQLNDNCHTDEARSSDAVTVPPSLNNKIIKGTRKHISCRNISFIFFYISLLT